MSKNIEIEKILCELKSLDGFLAADAIDIDAEKPIASAVQANLDYNELSRLTAVGQKSILAAMALINGPQMTYVMCSNPLAYTLNYFLFMESSRYDIAIAVDKKTCNLEDVKMKLAYVAGKISTILK